MTTDTAKTSGEQCPAEGLLKQLSGKWKPQIFRLALDGPLRFNTLLRQLPGSNKQSLAVALREMEASGLLTKTTVQEKPLHVEHRLSERGQALVGVFLALEHAG
jgi:DNA-binding HxlR family transcriptional regulator